MAFRGERGEAEAVRLLDQAVGNFRPLERQQEVAAYVFLGRLYARRRRFDEALARFRAARGLDPAATYALVDLGAFLADLGRSEEAEREWEATVRELGAASPTGLEVLRARRKRAGDLIDLTHLLGPASLREYESLVAHVGSARRLPALPVDKVLEPYIPLFREVLIDVSEDLDGDEQRERLVLDAVQTDEAFPDQFLVSGAVLRLFTLGRTDPYIFPTRFQHFHKLLVRDLDGDGYKEVILAGFREANLLTVVVLARMPAEVAGTGYSLALVVSVRCSAPWAGCLVTDLDGDGARETLFISGEDGWVDIYRWQQSQARLANPDFPRFYTAFLERWSEMSPAALSERPALAEKLRLARSYLAATP
jgi:tetratricopeptide (TPR) repeat protein